MIEAGSLIFELRDEVGKKLTKRLNLEKEVWTQGKMGQSPERKSLSAGLENILVLEGEDGRKEGQSSRKAGQHHLEYKC